MNPWSEPLSWIFHEKLYDRLCCMKLLEVCNEYLDFLYGALAATGRHHVLDAFISAAKGYREELMERISERIS